MQHLRDAGNFCLGVGPADFEVFSFLESESAHAVEHSLDAAVGGRVGGEPGDSDAIGAADLRAWEGWGSREFSGGGQFGGSGGDPAIGLRTDIVWNGPAVIQAVEDGIVKEEEFGNIIFDRDSGRVAAVQHVGSEGAHAATDFGVVGTEVEEAAKLNVGGDGRESGYAGSFGGIDDGFRGQGDGDVAAEPEGFNAAGNKGIGGFEGAAAVFGIGFQQGDTHFRAQFAGDGGLGERV